MNGPTPEQQAVLEANDRVRIVRAAPGCGKTWLVAEAIRRTLASWTGSGGIAALSFTNVGGNEIRRAVGHDLAHPHFVGTLDSFVYRYIVRQFAHILDPTFRRLRLVAADTADSIKFDARASTFLPDYAAKQPVSLFDVSFTGGIKDQAMLAVRKWGQAIPLSPTDNKLARAAKLKMWASHSWMSHSDVTYIAAAIFRDTQHGERIRQLLISRFPFLVVDELQDTGWYLSEVIRDLLGVKDSKGLLVGDPDQAIYQFNGARPELFDTFAKIPNSREFSVRKSLRCPSAITAVANHLRSGNVAVEPRDGDVGSASLIVTDDPAAALNEIRAVLGARTDGEVHNIISRGNDAVDELDGGKLPETPGFLSRPLTMAHQAVRHLIAGRSRKAIEAAKGCLLYVVANQPAPPEDLMTKIGIEPHQLRMAAARLLDFGRPANAAESCWSWGERMKAAILKAINDQGWTRLDGEPAAIKSCPKTLKDEKVALTLQKPAVASAQGNKIHARTVHAVKGETHHTTILYVPKPAGKRKCVSDSWWSNDVAVGEERRIAFVAATRSRRDFVMCVSPVTAKNLQSTRTQFYQCFRIMTARDYIASLKRT